MVYRNALPNVMIITPYTCTCISIKYSGHEAILVDIKKLEKSFKIFQKYFDLLCYVKSMECTIHVTGYI